MYLYKNDNIESIVQTKDYFMICWHMTGWCNYHCPYCIAEHLRTDWIPEDKIIENAKHLNNFIQKNIPEDRKIVFKLSGGELSFLNLKKILDNITRLDKVILASNLSQNLEFYYEMEDYFFERNIQYMLLCSWHAENKNFKEKFIQLTNWCRQHSKQKFNYKDPQLAIVVTPEFNFNVLEEFKEHDIWRIRLTRQRLSTQKNRDLSDDILQRIKEYNDYYDSRAITSPNSFCYKVTFKDSERRFACASNLTNFLDNNGFVPDNYYCTAGIDSLALMPDGTVSLARCDYLVNNILGNIKDWNSIEMPKTPVKCQLNANNQLKDKRCDLCAGTKLFRHWEDE